MGKKQKVQTLLERLKLDPDFKTLWSKAYNNPSDRAKYIRETRKLFNLSPFWEELILPIQFQQNPDDLVVLDVKIGQPIHEVYDDSTDRMMYLLPIYPESTLDEVKKAYGIISDKYKAEKYKLDVRQSSRQLDCIQYRAYELSKDGKTLDEISDIISAEFDTSYIKEEISSLITRAAKKSNR